MSTPCTNCQYLAYSCVCVKIQLIFPFFCRTKKRKKILVLKQSWVKNLDQELWFFKGTARTRGRTCWPNSAALSSLPLKWQPHSLLVQVVLSQINIFFHQVTQNIMNNFRQIHKEQFASIFVNLMQISRHILGFLMTEYVDLKKNNL